MLDNYSLFSTVLFSLISRKYVLSYKDSNVFVDFFIGKSKFLKIKISQNYEKSAKIELIFG